MLRLAVRGKPLTVDVATSTCSTGHSNQMKRAYIVVNSFCEHIYSISSTPSERGVESRIIRPYMVILSTPSERGRGGCHLASLHEDHKGAVSYGFVVKDDFDERSASLDAPPCLRADVPEEAAEASVYSRLCPHMDTFILF